MGLQRAVQRLTKNLPNLKKRNVTYPASLKIIRGLRYSAKGNEFIKPYKQITNKLIKLELVNEKVYKRKEELAESLRRLFKYFW